MQPFEKYGTLIERYTALIEKLSPPLGYALFEQVDRDNSGSVDRDEFVAAVRERCAVSDADMTTDELADVFNIVAQGAKTIDCDSFLDVLGYEEPDRDEAEGPDGNAKPATQKRRQEKERQRTQMQSALVTVIGSEDELTPDERWGLKIQKLFGAVATPTQAAYDRAAMMGVSNLIMHKTAYFQGKAAHLLRIHSIVSMEPSLTF
eukprot:SAG31_NODE_6540_length_1982_cov_164.242167_2_plen_205_part_00